MNGGPRNLASFKSHSDGSIGIGLPQFTLIWRLVEGRKQVGVCIVMVFTSPKMLATQKYICTHTYTIIIIWLRRSIQCVLN